MLTISLDRLSDLLEKAAEIDLALPFSADEEETDATAAEEIAIDDAIDDPAYQELLQSLGALPPGEQYELMALALLARGDAGPDEWEAMLEQARALRDVDLVDELARVMLLTDEIEMALDRLGIDLEIDDEESEEDAEEEDQ